MILTAIVLECVGLIFWWLICSIPVDLSPTPRAPRWQDIDRSDWTVGLVITTGLVVTLVSSMSCWL